MIEWTQPKTRSSGDPRTDVAGETCSVRAVRKSESFRSANVTEGGDLQRKLWFSTDRCS